jgi:hypothetical protein
MVIKHVEEISNCAIALKIQHYWSKCPKEEIDRTSKACQFHTKMILEFKYGQSKDIESQWKGKPGQL